MDEQNELISVAMQIILHAGDARNFARESLSLAKNFEFEKADHKLKEAEESLVLAHKSQTEIIQNEASGHSYQFSLLFAHAQDTLMTIQSELKMSKEMIDILKIISKQSGEHDE